MLLILITFACEKLLYVTSIHVMMKMMQIYGLNDNICINKSHPSHLIQALHPFIACWALFQRYHHEVRPQTMILVILYTLQYLHKYALCINISRILTLANPQCNFKVDIIFIT